MSENEWKDRRVPRLFFKKPKAPTAFETEAFVSRVMDRIEERTPAFGLLLDLLGRRWTVPALSLGLATLLISILFSGPMSPLTLEASVSPDDAPAAWALPLEEAP